MKPLHKKPSKKQADHPAKQKAGLLWYIIGMVIILTIYRLLISVVTHLRLFQDITDYQRHTQGLATFLLVLMMGLLWMAYRQWQNIIHERDQLETILASIGPDMILAVDHNDRILRCGGAVEQMSGYTPDELIGKKAGLLYHDRRIDGQGYEIQSALEQTGFYMGYTTGRTRNGEDYLLEMQTSRLTSQAGGAVVILRNLDERQRARVQLQRRIRMEETFAAISTEFLQTEPKQFGKACLTALQKTAEIFGYEFASAGFFDMQSGELRNIWTWPPNQEILDPAFNTSLAEAAIASADTKGRIAYRFPEDSDRAPAPLEDLHTNWKIRAMVLSPMKLQDRQFGFLALFSKERNLRRWTPEDTTVLQALTSTFMAGELSIHSRRRFQTGSE
ncbi:PAS domain S-box protein [Tichowtungia aerotolerans]|uniref:PAS domain S-box protein n=1 Tax=Tichowtungia aerotolerans TaxID=2697043 RepID=A0A6P1M2F6_9BACT|nr:PAS domain S-box protein [Tichowtungia aerotolerans]QHI68292.1 PAS domain S-box protein [Tichowtungia aerotolerans]